jgi:hypothetical protein
MPLTDKLKTWTQPAPTPQELGGAQQQTGDAQTGGGQQQTGGGAAQQPASLSDFGIVAGNENLMGTIPYLRTQAEAARQRLGPAGAAAAEMTGAATSPTNILYRVPFAGPGLAGGLHEGIKAYNAQPNWIPTWSDAEKIGAATAEGAGAGYAGAGVAKALTKPDLYKWGGGLLGAAATHQFLPSWFPGQELLGATGAYNAAKQGADWTANKLANPAAQQAIKNLIQGGNAATWNQWQAGS